MNASKSSMVWDLIVVGGGASGFFGAIQVATQTPNYKILILEKSSKLLTKVRISGGGRCNVTHNCFNPFDLARHYPRGGRDMKVLFKTFHAGDLVAWFESKGVQLKTEADGRMFPVTDDSETIINCFMREASRLHIAIETNQMVKSVERNGDVFELATVGGSFKARKILVAIGGNKNMESYGWIKQLGHTIATPIPSLFTFNDQDKRFKDLMGVSVPQATVKVVGTKLSQQGPVLITHWGLSGPAVIKLSAWAAEHLYQQNYQFDVLLSWIGTTKEEEVRAYLQENKRTAMKQKVINHPHYRLPQRLWQRLCLLSEIDESKVWGDLSHRHLNKLLEYLIRCPIQVSGKTTYKEEFVTCGGVVLTEIDSESMESKFVKNLYFAGEVLHIDGETGGFNFQAAWTTAYLAARSISKGSI